MVFWTDIPCNAIRKAHPLIYYLLVNTMLIPDYVITCSTK